MMLLNLQLLLFNQTILLHGLQQVKDYLQVGELYSKKYLYVEKVVPHYVLYKYCDLTACRDLRWCTMTAVETSTPCYTF